MKHKPLHHKALDHIRDAALKQRLLEELEDHLDELESEGKDISKPWKLLGDPEIIALQVNLLNQPWFKHIFFGLAGSFAIFILLNLLIFDVDASPVKDVGHFKIQMVGAFGALMVWGTFLFFLSFSLIRWFLTHFGLSSRAQFLIRAMLCIPYGVFLINQVSRIALNVFSKTPNISDLVIQAILSIGTSILIAYAAHRMAFRYGARDQKLHHKLSKIFPFLLGGITTLGTMVTFFEPLDDSWLGTFFVFAFLFMMVLYLFWGALAQILGALLTKFSIPMIYGFTAFTGVLLLVVAWIFLRRIRRKPWNYSEKIALALLLPLFIVVPFQEQDIPHIQWEVPVVWTWEDFENRQLSFTYPWNAPLMRSNDGINLSYEARLEGGQLQVLQSKGPLLEITVEGSSTLERVNTIAPNAIPKIDPEGFTCTERMDPTQGEHDFPQLAVLFSDETVFGINCGTLYYQGQKLALIDKGNIVNLTLSDDGLLAVTLNMGSYDPDYVYVVDVSGIKD